MADLYRDRLTIPVAFKAAKIAAERSSDPVERLARRMIGAALAKDRVIPERIERIKALIEGREP